MKRKILITSAIICGIYIIVSVYFLSAQKRQLDLYEKYYEVAEHVFDCWENLDEALFEEWINSLEFCEYYSICKELGKKYTNVTFDMEE